MQDLGEKNLPEFGRKIELGRLESLSEKAFEQKAKRKHLSLLKSSRIQRITEFHALPLIGNLAFINDFGHRTFATRTIATRMFATRVFLIINR